MVAGLIIKYTTNIALAPPDHAASPAYMYLMSLILALSSSKVTAVTADFSSKRHRMSLVAGSIALNTHCLLKNCPLEECCAILATSR